MDNKNETMEQHFKDELLKLTETQKYLLSSVAYSCVKHLKGRPSGESSYTAVIFQILNDHDIQQWMLNYAIEREKIRRESEGIERKINDLCKIQRALTEEIKSWKEQ